ncbi:MAG: hypothetical protein JWM74_4278 [Myxococcaceae bacterium]|nr:hypothetical protein [Myxococcaceae bacterium]
MATLGCTLALALPLLAGCKDQGKISAQRAAESGAALAKLAESDVAEVERGLPEGAKRLAPLFAKNADLTQDVGVVRTALGKTRREVPDLAVAKTTFLALTDGSGVAIRNNLEEDVMAGKNLVTLFPELAKVQAGSFIVTTGAFPGQTIKEQDRDWIAAAPVKSDDGKVVGLFVTGWTYRRLAYRLHESLKHDLEEQMKKDGDTTKLPIFYVAVFDKTGVYSPPQTPTVNEKALTDADLVGKTTAGPAQGVLDITERAFGYGAVRVPKLGPEAGVVVLRSEL